MSKGRKNTTKKSNTWLWVLGWLFIFPLPLTILLLRNKGKNSKLKYGIVVIVWIFYFIIGFSGKSNESSSNDMVKTTNNDNYTLETTVDEKTKSNIREDEEIVEREDSIREDEKIVEREDSIREDEKIVEQEDSIREDEKIVEQEVSIREDEEIVEPENSSNQDNTPDIVIENDSFNDYNDASNNKDSSGVTVPTKEDTEGNLVWVPTEGGTKYHSKSTCSKMKNPIQVTKEHAEANGFTPCGRCY